MKKRDLEKIMTAHGWSFLREGGAHEVWGNGSGTIVTLPRHNEINEITALKIISKVKGSKKP